MRACQYGWENDLMKPHRIINTRHNFTHLGNVMMNRTTRTHAFMVNDWHKGEMM